jgi:hypothetical protein
MFNALFLAYAIIQIGEIRSSLNPSATAIVGISHIPIEVLTTIIPVVISVAEVAYIGLGWKIYNEFGWKVYKLLGADRRIKKMYATYQIFECIVKFDVFFWVGFSVQFIWLVLQKSDWEYYVTCAALPLSILLLIEGHLAARHENKWMMATFMSGCVGALVYFIYKVRPTLSCEGQVLELARFCSSPKYLPTARTLNFNPFSSRSLLFVSVRICRPFRLRLTSSSSGHCHRFVGRDIHFCCYRDAQFRTWTQGSLYDVSSCSYAHLLILSLRSVAKKRDPPLHQRYPSHSAHHRRAASTNLNRMSIE